MAKITAYKQDTTTIGLDIGSYSVKCVEIVRASDKFRLQRVSILPIDPAAPDGVTKTLKLLFDAQTASTKRIRIAVSGGGSTLLIRRIQLPNMTAAELRGAIRFEAEGHIPFPVEECQIDFQILNQTPDKKSMNVMLAAAKKDLIKERLKTLAALNIVPEVIDVDIFCLINAYEILGQEAGEATFGLLNIGHRVSSFAIVQDKAPYFVREIPFGASAVTKALAELKGVKEAEADRLKIEKAPETLADLNAAMIKGFEPLIEEMRHSIDYVENESGEELKTIRLSGGGALCPGTGKMLSEELGKDVALWDNTKRLEIFGDIDQKFLAEHSPELNVALGMVLRSSGGKK